MNYTDEMLRSLEGDIYFWCSRYHIPGYELEDLQQECRFKLWRKIENYDAQKGILVRTWANTVIKNHLKDLLRKAMNQKNYVLNHSGEFNEEIAVEISNFEEIFDRMMQELDDFCVYIY